MAANMRRLVVFKHDCELGKASASSLFDLVTASRRDAAKPPRSFTDYELQVPGEKALPQGVSMEVRPRS